MSRLNSLAISSSKDLKMELPTQPSSQLVKKSMKAGTIMILVEIMSKSIDTTDSLPKLALVTLERLDFGEWK